MHCLHYLDIKQCLYWNIKINTTSLDIQLRFSLSAEIQIIGMSATLGNLSDLQEFLDADIYCNDFRPVSALDLSSSVVLHPRKKFRD